MARLQNSTTRSDAGPLLGGLAALGLTLAFVALRRSKREHGDEATDRRDALAAYLRDHLAGADTAIQTVQGLRDAHRGPEGALFVSLYEQFREDRAVVEGMLAELGYTSRSAKRLAGRATGSALRVVAGGAPGDLSLFRTLEALAISVQGKDACGERRRRLSPSRTRLDAGRLSNSKRMQCGSGRASSGIVARSCR